MSDVYYQPRKVNLLAVAIVTVATAGLGAGLYYLHGWQLRRNAASFLAQAEKEGDLRKTAEHLMQYLAVSPKQEDTRKEFARYAELMANKKLAVSPRQKMRALFLIDHTLRRDPTHDHLRRIAARLSIEL